MKRPSIAIIGGGIAGLSAGFFIKQKLGEQVDFCIYEKEDRAGGTIGTTRENGYLADWGPNGFLDKEPLTLEFIERIGLKEELLPANAKSEKRFIFRNNRLWEVSANPLKFMASGLLSRKGRLRIAAELFISARREKRDESIFDFAVRRIGREAAEILIDPMVSGIFGGDAETLSLGACFPVMEEMERDHGGLIKAMIKKKREKKDNGAKGGPAGPSGHLTSFHGGLYTLIEHLAKVLGDNIRLSTEIKYITVTSEGRYLLHNPAERREFDWIILAVPSYAAAKILAGISPRTADLLTQIPYSNIAVVCQGYRLENIGRPVDGFGFLVPHSQNLEILGSIWTSEIFPEQAPAGYALFRTMLGGARNNQIVDLGEEKLARLVHGHLSTIMNITAIPSFEKVIIWRGAIPQYVIGHRARLEGIENNLSRLGHIYLAGNAYTGISLNDTIKRSNNITDTIAKTILKIDQ